MDSFDPTEFLKENSVHTVCTMDTDDLTNRSASSSDFLGASLDLDRHGARANIHQRTSQRGYIRGAEYHDCLGDSLLMEESFAFGESFSCCEDGGCFLENQRGHTFALRLRPDISSVLAIEENKGDGAQESGDDEETNDKSSTCDLEQKAQKLTLEPPTCNFSLEAREG